LNGCARKLSGITKISDSLVKVEWVAQKAAPGRTMDIRLKLLFKATSKTLQDLEVVGHLVRTHRHLPRVSAVAEVEDSPIFPGFRVNWVNCLTFSAVLGLEAERALEMRLLNLAHMPHRTLPPNLRMTTDRMGLFNMSRFQTNHRHTRSLTHRPLRLTTLGSPEKAINLPTKHPHRSGSAAEPVGTVVLMVGSTLMLGMVGPRNRHHNHGARQRTRGLGRQMDNTGSLGELRVWDFLTLSKDSDSERPT
jgi:hypothetical protein